ncbi:hypothetical protein OAH12_02525 [Cyclobacteriaceae bacterium]|nr:hypothetical protein [Cyclobacteriaceae bacterium]
MKKIYKILFLLILIAFSCRKPPDYSEVPEIAFNSIQNFQVAEGFNFVDSFNIKIDFRDGNGNLGLDASDLENSDIFIGDFSKNYFCTMYKRENGTWNELSDDLNSQFMRLLTEGGGAY